MAPSASVDLEQLLSAALVAHRAGHLPEAAERYDAALRVDPRSPAALYYGGVAALQLGQPAEAARRLEALVAIAPQHADVWYHLGLARERCGAAADVGDPRAAILRAAGNAVLLVPESAHPDLRLQLRERWSRVFPDAIERVRFFPRLDLGELIASDPVDYAARAVAIGRDPQRRASLRERMRSAAATRIYRDASGLPDYAAFFEAALAQSPLGGNG